MAITIAYPLTKDANKPTKLPRKFIALGKKGKDESPAGVLVSVDQKSHLPDGEVVIGGVPIAYKKKDKATGKLVDESDKWAMFFALSAKLPPGDRLYSLLVYDAKKLPAVTEKPTQKQEIEFVRSDNLAAVRREPKKKDEKGVKFMLATFPPSGTSLVADMPVVMGDLTGGDYDIDTGTKITDFTTGGDICTPDWWWSDGTSFFAAFFPAIDKMTYTKVNTVVVFKPSGDIVEETEITLV